MDIFRELDDTELIEYDEDLTDNLTLISFICFLYFFCLFDCLDVSFTVLSKCCCCC